MRSPRLGALLLLTCCADSVGPEACREMCESAGSLYATCLEEWGLDWGAAGYEDADDYALACETWSWEAELLERDAIRAGRAQSGDLEAACSSRAILYASADVTCEDWVAAPWSALPWDG